MTDFTRHTLESAPKEAKPLLTEIQQSYGFTPNMFWYMAEAPTTIKAYLALNELVSQTSLNPAQQQLALLAVSKANGCDFCTVAHRAIGKMSAARQQTLDAINNNDTIEDEQDRALVNLAQSFVNNKGRPHEDDLQAFYAAGFNKQQVLEVILTVTIKTLSNYSNHLSEPEANPELLAML